MFLFISAFFSLLIPAHKWNYLSIHAYSLLLNWNLLICKIKRRHQVVTDVFVTKNNTTLSLFLNISLNIRKGSLFKSIFIKPGLGIHPFLVIRIGVSTASAGYMIHILSAVIPPKDGRNAAIFFIEIIQKCFPVFEKVFLAEGMILYIFLYSFIYHRYPHKRRFS